MTDIQLLWLLRIFFINWAHQFLIDFLGLRLIQLH